MLRYFLFTLLLWDAFTYAQNYVPVRDDTVFRVQPAVQVQAHAFALNEVRLLGSPFYQAMQRDSAYLSQLNPDRLLHRFRLHAGLPVKDSIYGGWEKEGLSGHTLGHFLSALSLMHAGTGSVEFKAKVEYIVDELERCQFARETGYVGAIPNEDSIFAQVARGQIKSSGFDLNGGWSPWYTVHKVMAGLCDAYIHCGNKKALDVVVRMADWVHGTVAHLPDSARLKMLNCEYGGMNEVLANIYALTGDKKYLSLSYLFYDEFVMGRLARMEDPLPGKHSNTNVPKAIGSARQHELTGADREKRIAAFFWERMVNHHSYVIGGNSNYEYCGAADSLNERLSDNTCETCNTYNMLKLTHHLFALAPSASLMDFYERALYNHILASQHPQTGMMCYFVPLRMGTQKQYSDAFNTFTCCVGSGMENHSKYGEAIYSEGSDGSLYVNLFIPSVLQWSAQSARVTLTGDFPRENKIAIRIFQAKAKVQTLRIRKPYWIKGDMQLLLNGRSIVPIEIKDGYVTVRHAFQNDDILECLFPMGVYTESMPDNKDRIAFKYGPLVLAGMLGNERPDPVLGVPVLLTDDRRPAQWVQRTSDSLIFKWNKVGRPFDVNLQPFYSTGDSYYSVYFDYFTEKDWKERQLAYEAEKEREALLEKKTIDHFRVGEMQPERDHRLQASERSYVDDALGRKGREARAGNFYSFWMKVDSLQTNALVCTYIGDDKDRIFDLLIEGEKVAKVEWKGGKTGTFYDLSYPIPASLTKGKERIQVRVEANYGKTAGRIFSVRTVRE